MASPGCSWCRLTPSGSSLSRPHCDSVNNCYCWITGLSLRDINIPATNNYDDEAYVDNYDGDEYEDDLDNGGIRDAALFGVVLGTLVVFITI